jgi:hypothetical protein
MERLALLFATATIAACSAASEPKSPTLSCVPANSCGCSIIVSGNTCPNGGVHFFHELADGSPLQFDFGQGAVTATSKRARTNVFSPGPGDSGLKPITITAAASRFATLPDPTRAQSSHRGSSASTLMYMPGCLSPSLKALKAIPG